MSIKIYSTVRDRNDRLTRQKDREFVPRPECMDDRDRGALRIIASPEIAALKTVAFENPDGEIVAVVQNATDSEFKWHLHFRGQTLERKAFAHSIETFCFPK